MLKFITRILLCFILLCVPLINTQMTYATTLGQPIDFDDADDDFVLEREHKVHPASVEFFPESIPVHEAVLSRSRPLSKLNAKNSGRGIKLAQITPSFLRKLTKKELSKLLDFLGKNDIKIRWADIEGHTRSGRTPFKLKRFIPIGTKDKINAAAAVAIAIAAREDSDATLARMLACSSDIILDGLQNNSKSILTAEVVSQALWDMTTDLTMRDPGGRPTRNLDIMVKASNLVHCYVKYWGAKNPDYLKRYLQHMVRLATDYGNDIMSETDPAFQHHMKSAFPMQVGVLLGALLSGTQTWIQEIEHSDVKRAVYVNSVSNLVWATSSFISLIGLFATVSPVGAPIAAVVVPAGLGTAAVLAAALYNLRCGVPRNYNDIVQRVKGVVKTSMLETAPMLYQQLLVQNTLFWMQATLNTNGHND